MREEVVFAIEEAVDRTIYKTVAKFAQMFRALADEAALQSLTEADIERRSYSEGFAEGLAVAAITLESAAKELEPKVAA